MRLARLLLVFAFLTICGGIAVGQESKTDQPKSKAQQDYIKPMPAPELSSPANPADNNKSHEFTWNGVPHRVTGPLNDKIHRLTQDYAAALESSDCLVMHTIQVARDSKESDSTHVVKVTNCTPAKRFQMKSAVATPQQK